MALPDRYFMSYTELLTISIPCHERKDFFKAALESALNQTVQCKVIVIDNASSHDYFEKICREKNVTYYRNEVNIGLPGNFSKGFELAESKYTMNLQNDDLLSPYYVESFLKAVSLYPDIDIFYSDTMVLKSNKAVPHKHILPFGYMPDGKKIIEYGIKYKLGFPYIASAIKKTIAHSFLEVHKEIGSWDWFWLYFNAEKFSFYGDAQKLYFFREHGNQDSKHNRYLIRLTLPYIYDKILKDKVSDPKLKRKASVNAFWELVRLKSFSGKKRLEKILNENPKYREYLKKKLNDNYLLRIIFHLPHQLVKFTYKSLRKIGLSG
jgi:glycosyltransferase involved in cell wall biosynthesis